MATTPADETPKRKPAKRRAHPGQHHIRERDDGLWEARLSLGTLPDGRRNRPSVYAPSYAALLIKIGERLDEEARKGPPQAHDPLCDYLPKWLTRRAETPPRLAYNTHRRYDSIIRTHLIPALGDTTLDDLSRRQVQRLLDDMRRANKSVSLVRDTRTVLISALKHAVRDDVLDKNVALDTSVASEEREAVQPLTPEEAKRYLAAARGESQEALFTAVLAVGIRQGEALGLMWERVNLDTGHVRIERQLIREKGRWVPDKLKTPASRRTVFLPPFAVESLRFHRARQEAARALWESAGAAWGNEWGLVFTTGTGRPIHATTIRNQHHAICARAGVPDGKFHNLRHACASLLIAQGVPMQYIADLLGHASTRVTEAVYGHLYDAGRQAVAARMQELFSPGGDTAGGSAEEQEAETSDTRG